MPQNLSKEITKTIVPSSTSSSNGEERTVGEVRPIKLGGNNDFRDWIKAVDSMGELRIIKGANWNMEIGGISQLNYRRRPNRALLFDEIKDYPAGYRILTASMGSVRRMALTFRLPTELDDRGLIEELRG